MHFTFSQSIGFAIFFLRPFLTKFQIVFITPSFAALNASLTLLKKFRRLFVYLFLSFFFNSLFVNVFVASFFLLLFYGVSCVNPRLRQSIARFSFSMLFTSFHVSNLISRSVMNLMSRIVRKFRIRLRTAGKSIISSFYE